MKKKTDETVTGLFGEMDYNHQQKLRDSSVNGQPQCCKIT